MNTEHHGDETLVVAGEPRLHRFRISVVADTAMVIWLEDRVSKLQWRTRELEKSDFVNEENAVPRASLTDYAKHFAECLGGTKTSSDSAIDVEWSVDHEKTPTLKLVLPLQWSSYVATVHYIFRMEHVDLQPVDLVAARLADVEEMIRNPEGDGTSLVDVVRELDRRLRDMTCGASATTTTPTATDDVIMWTPNEAARVVATIQHTSAESDKVCVLLHNDKTVKTISKTNKKAVALEDIGATSLKCVVDAKKDDELVFVYKGTNEAIAGSTVTIWRLV